MPEPTTPTCPSSLALESHVSGAPSPELARHLETCAACRAALGDMHANLGLLERIRRDLSEDETVAPSARPEVPGYTLHEELERGAQGVVYRATQRATSRSVALKVLIAGGLATSAQRRRFEREIELIAAIDHPNVVTVYESGRTREGHAYLAMRLVDGRPMDVWLEEMGRAPHPPDTAAILRLFASICDAVSAAHLLGIMHRDLKPGNVLIDRDGLPHVVDFGLARPLAEDAPTMTMEGAFLGTLAYAAPEQVRRDAGPVDVRTDVYALGAMLRQLLTHETPFDAGDDLASMVRAICEEAPPPARPWRAERRFAIPADVQTIMRTAMAKQKSHRYQSAAALRDDVRHCLAGEPIDAKREQRGYVLRKWLRRHWLVTTGSLAVALLLAGLVSVTAIKNRRIALEAEKLKQTVLFLEDTLGSAGSPDARVVEVIDEAVEWIDIALGDEPEVAAEIHTTAGNCYRNLGRYEDAERQLQAGLALRREHLGEEDAAVAQSLNALGLLRRDEGRFDDAEELFDRALAIRARVLGPGSYEASLSLSNLATLARRRGDLTEAERRFREVRDLREALFGPEHGDVAMIDYQLAEVAIEQGDLDEARRLHEQALALRRAVLHERHPDLVRSVARLGHLLLELDESDAALRYLVEADERLADRFGYRHARRFPVVLDLARASAGQGDCGRALGLLGIYMWSEEPLSDEQTAGVEAARVAVEASCRK